VTCFGGAQRHQLGDRRQAVRDGFTAARVSGVLEIDAGVTHTCVRTDDDRMRCWGDNTDHQLGGMDRFTADMIDVPLADVRAIATGAWHSCAIVGDAREVWCFGANTFGQLGVDIGGEPSTPVPTMVPGLFGAVQIAGGYYGTCVLLDTQQIRCFGQPGGTQTVIATLDDPIAIAAGHFFVCALQRNGEVWCWGQNGHGMIGDGTFMEAPGPTRVAGLTGIVDMDANGSHACGRTDGGALFCWGDNTWFQLGDGTDVDNNRARRVEGVPPVTEIECGESHTCVVADDGELWCWGHNHSGQTGVPLRPVDHEPELVLGLP
jgi:alpha-tubulin suppressor-like RCC1 family protein